jgi:hypothetical protein
MRTYTIDLAAGAQEQIYAAGRYFLLMDHTGEVTVRDSTGAINAKVPAGIGYPAPETFEWLALESELTQRIKILIAENHVQNNRVAGSIDTVRLGADNLTTTNPTVGDGSAVEVLGQNDARADALIYTPSLIYVAGSAAKASAAEGMPVKAGGTYNHTAKAPLWAISDSGNVDLVINEEAN